MKLKEAEKTERKLARYTQLSHIDTTDKDGYVLSVQWTDGGQRIFYSTQEVEDWLENKLQNLLSNFF